MPDPGRRWPARGRCSERRRPVPGNGARRRPCRAARQPRTAAAVSSRGAPESSEKARSAIGLSSVATSATGARLRSMPAARNASPVSVAHPSAAATGPGVADSSSVCSGGRSGSERWLAALLRGDDQRRDPPVARPATPHLAASAAARSALEPVAGADEHAAELRAREASGPDRNASRRCPRTRAAGPGRPAPATVSSRDQPLATGRDASRPPLALAPAASPSRRRSSSQSPPSRRRRLRAPSAPARRTGGRAGSGAAPSRDASIGAPIVFSATMHRDAPRRW